MIIFLYFEKKQKIFYSDILLFLYFLYFSILYCFILFFFVIYRILFISLIFIFNYPLKLAAKKGYETLKPEDESFP